MEDIAIKNKIEAPELLKTAPFRKDVRKTRPHKHKNYAEIIYLSKGHGTHTIDHTPYPIHAPTIFLVRQEQVHHWNITDEPEGYVVLLRKGFLQQSLDSELKNALSRLSALNCLQLAKSDTIETLFHLLAHEKEFVVVEGLLKALLTKILAVSQPVSMQKRKTNDLLLRFRDLLNETDNLHNNVAYYADKLNTTPQNLNAVCKKALNQPASQTLAEHIVNEAKRLLLYTGIQGSQIAHHLHFKDNSHFIKYFKRHTGSTPQAYRLHQNNHHIFK